jgi:hypothetical protein
MSEENVEVVKAWLDAWNRNDWDGMEQCFAADCEVYAPEGWLESGPFKAGLPSAARWSASRIHGNPSESRLMSCATWVSACSRAGGGSLWEAERDRKRDPGHHCLHYPTGKDHPGRLFLGPRSGPRSWPR